MKEKYVSPTFDIVTFKSESIITTSLGELQESYETVMLNEMLFGES
ncbi:MAG: hypothetical protein IJ583_09690 [Firmicutes bacterium]|nr:hypothetical protein [Bacillota bacterium]